MPPLRPESRWSTTLVQTVSVVTTVAIAAWYVRGTFEQVLQELSELKREQQEMRADLNSRYVTQEQAERYASDFRWVNRGISLEVPSPAKFRTVP